VGDPGGCYGRQDQALTPTVRPVVDTGSQRGAKVFDFPSTAAQVARHGSGSARRTYCVVGAASARHASGYGALRTQRKPMASRARQASEKPGSSPWRAQERSASTLEFQEPPRRT
jgi:hypothetical protein